MKRMVLEHVAITDEGGAHVYQCTECGRTMGTADRNFKEYAAKRERPYRELLEAGMLFVDSDRFIIREFYCPGCGTLLDVENALKGEPYLDIRLSI